MLDRVARAAPALRPAKTAPRADGLEHRERPPPVRREAAHAIADDPQCEPYLPKTAAPGIKGQTPPPTWTGLYGPLVLSKRTTWSGCERVCAWSACLPDG
jgi:hypothetical protein